MKSVRRKLRKNMTDAEQRLWYFLKDRRCLGVKFRRQVSIGAFIVDFVSFDWKLVIEVDGGQHNEAEGKTKDNQRDEFLRKEGFVVLRFWNHEVFNETAGVLAKIESVLGT